MSIKIPPKMQQREFLIFVYFCNNLSSANVFKNDFVVRQWRKIYDATKKCYCCVLPALLCHSSRMIKLACQNSRFCVVVLYTINHNLNITPSINYNRVSTASCFYLRNLKHFFSTIFHLSTRPKVFLLMEYCFMRWQLLGELK